MWLPIFGLIIGVTLGLLTDFNIPAEYSNYLSIAILAALDTLFGGIRAQLQNVYDEKVFVSGFFFNIVLAASRYVAAVSSEIRGYPVLICSDHYDK